MTTVVGPAAQERAALGIQAIESRIALLRTAILGKSLQFTLRVDLVENMLSVAKQNLAIATSATGMEDLISDVEKTTVFLDQSIAAIIDSVHGQ